MCERAGGVLVPCRAAVLRIARERQRVVQPPFIPLGLDPCDMRPEVTRWDYRPSSHSAPNSSPRSCRPKPRMISTTLNAANRRRVG